MLITCFNCFKNSSIDNENVNLIINDKLIEKSKTLSIDAENYRKRMLRDSKLDENNITKGAVISLFASQYEKYMKADFEKLEKSMGIRIQSYDKNTTRLDQIIKV